MNRPEEDPQFDQAAGRLCALKGDGCLVAAPEALLNLSQHALVDGRALIEGSNVVHAAERGCLPLHAACVH